MEWLLPLAGGSVVAVLVIVGGVWGLKRLVEWAGADALAKGLADHQAKIDERLAEQQRTHEETLAALRTELGLDAERRRHSEARRRETCEGLYAAASRLDRALRRVLEMQRVIREATSKEYAKAEAPHLGEARKEVDAALKAIDDLFEGHGGLYLSSAMKESWGKLVVAYSAGGIRQRFEQFEAGLEDFRATLRREIQLDPREAGDGPGASTLLPRENVGLSSLVERPWTPPGQCHRSPPVGNANN